MKEHKKYIFLNLGIVVLYSLLLRLYCSMGEGTSSGDYMMYMMVTVSVHFLVTLIAAFGVGSNGNPDLGKALLLSAGLVALIGFSACLGGIAS